MQTAPAPAPPFAAHGGEQAVVESMQAYYAQRASQYERVYHKPERQVDLRAVAAWLDRLHRQLEAGARVVMLDNRYVQTSNLPITRRDDDGNTYQQRRLDDGSVHEVLKNFPTRDEALAAIGPRARNARWIEHEHYWVLSYDLD